MKKRIFLAVPVPDSIKTSLKAYRDVFPDSQITWVEPANYHITVTFFGEQEEASLPTITTLTKQVTERLESFELTFQSILMAPPEKVATMIWAQYVPHLAFTSLVQIIENQANMQLTFTDKREGHSPLPHITLGRSKSFSLTALPQIELDPISVTELVLYESQKTEEGRVYTILETFKLR